MLKKIILTLIALIVIVVASGFAYVSVNQSPQLFEKSVAGLYQTEGRLVNYKLILANW